MNKKRTYEWLLGLGLAVCLGGCGRNLGIYSAELTDTIDRMKQEFLKRNEEDQEAARDCLKESVSGREGSKRDIPQTMPSSYDGRKYGKAACVRNQGKLGTCWAFASLSALESRLLPEERWDFSEDHMSHNPNFLLGQTGGGEYTMAMAYLLSWQGPVREEEDPYGDGISPQGLKPAKHVQEIQILPDSDIEVLKRAVYVYGGVESSIYMDMKYADDNSMYYNAVTHAYCNTQQQLPNHDIVIVGWDDYFPKEAFTEDVCQDGAFLCENSWGESFGDDGFFYISYEDCNIGKNNIVYTGVEEPDRYTKIYQSDLCGWIGQLGYGEETAWGANVYQADETINLQAAGFYAIDQNTDYEIYVVRKVPKQPGSMAFMKRQKKASGYLQYSGYYTIAFDEPVEIGEGERFAVMVRLTTPGVIHPIAIEFDAGDGKCAVDLKDGEGYASPDGRQWDRVETKQNCNLCLKAYATSS